MFLFQFERREAGFVITGYNAGPNPDGKSRFCTGLQFNSRQDAKEYVERVAAIRRASGPQASGDSIGRRWEEAKRDMEALEKEFAGKCRKVVFDIPYSKEKEPGVKDRVYTAKEVRNIDYQDGIGAKNGKLPSRVT